MASDKFVQANVSIIAVEFFIGWSIQFTEANQHSACITTSYAFLLLWFQYQFRDQ